MPSVGVGLHPAAIDEARAALHWYRERSDQAGTAFEVELDRAMRLIGEAPERWPTHLHGTRRFLLRRFPFLIIYRFATNEAEIIAIAHAKRRPGYWSGR